MLKYIILRGWGGVSKVNKMSKERFEILLEGMKSDIKLVLEGHSVLDNKIEEVKTSIGDLDLKIEDTRVVVRENSKDLRETNLKLEDTNRKLDETNLKVDETNRKVDETNGILKKHIKQPAHA